MPLQLTKISKSFSGTQKQILSNISVTLTSKKFIGILGPSGCGKTTLLRIMAGLEDANSGLFSLDGEAIFDLDKKFSPPPEKRNIGMVFQNYALWPHMTVGENLAFPLKLKKLAKDVIDAEVNTHLALVDLTEHKQKLPSQLSGGQQQRVALARALIQKPRLLLLDEPLSNLDASLRSSIRQELKKLQREQSLTFVIVTHDWDDAAELCDEIIILNQGQVEQQGSPADIYKNPKSTFVKNITKQ